MNTIDEKRLKKSADYLRYLALEAIERAKSGHPGLPLGCAELGILIYRHILRYNAQDPHWANRDRFLLSAGHGSMFLYSLLHFAGYPITLKDIGQFRQLHSKTPGHPEFDQELGVEITAGPLGQGIAAATGCAIQGKMLAQRFNRPNFPLFDYSVFTLAGDGCMMEGISYEAASLAGHLGLDNLIAIYDSNSITIDGRTDITFTENVAERFRALGWHTDASPISQPQLTLDKLIHLKSLKGKPKLLIVTTTIGEGLNKKKDSSASHGAPAGLDEFSYFIQHSPDILSLFQSQYGQNATADAAQLKEILSRRLKSQDPILPLPDALDYVRENQQYNLPQHQSWQNMLAAYRQTFPEPAALLDSFREFSLPKDFRQLLLEYKEEKGDATRNVAGRVLNLCADNLPQLIGGTADLVGSTNGRIKNSGYIARDDFSQRNIAFGVREHAMTAIGNGLALDRGFIPFTSTFFTFFDYMKPAVRLAALMKLRHLFLFTHDSIYVGEDGPTHQPVEHLNSLRLLPGCHTFRTANDAETAFAFLYFLEKAEGPVALVASRQKLADNLFNSPPHLNREDLYAQFLNGGYRFYQTRENDNPDIILAASGSEVDAAMQTASLLEQQDNKNVRVISIPCLELLAETDAEYRQHLFAGFTPPVYLIEAASHRGVSMFYHPGIQLIDLHSFGVSAAGEITAEYFGFTAKTIRERILRDSIDGKHPLPHPLLKK